MEEVREVPSVIVLPQSRQIGVDRQQDRLLGHSPALAIAVILSQIQTAFN